MRSRFVKILLAAVIAMLMAGAAQARGPLAGVKTVQVDDTVVGNEKKVKETQGPNQVADSLRMALRNADFEIGDAPVRAHIVLDEFTSGNQAERSLVGFGAGRSTIDCRLVIQDAQGKELANAKIHVHGRLLGSPESGGNTQRRQAMNAFEQRLLEEIEKLK
jgi:Domain of unknown function (DUF4410)